jgi:hypothetical protein
LEDLQVKALFCTIGLFVSLISFSHKSAAAELVTNGGFETGNFSGWTATNATSAWRLWTVSASGFGGNEGGAFVPVPNATSVQQGTFNAWHGVSAGTGQSFLLIQNLTIPTGVNVRLTWMDRYQMNYTQFCGVSPVCGTATYAVEILNTSNTLLQTLYTVTTLNNTNSNTGWVNHVASLTPYGGQTIRLRFRTTVTHDLRGPGQLEVDAVSAQTLTVTSAEVPVSGRATKSDGRGISGAIVSMTDAAGVVKLARTSAFGYYQFDNVESGGTYVIAIGQKRYFFADSPRVITVTDSLSGVDFVASP